MKKHVSLILCVLLLLTAIPFGFTASADEIPDGFTPIYDSMDLYCVRFDLSGKYILMDDIDLTDDIAPDGDLELEGRGWDPIGGEGRYAGLYFTGTFDGNGHTISGLWVNIDETFTGTGEKYAGLFANNTGTIQNLTVSGSIFGATHGGLIAGNNGGTIQNCTAMGSVESTTDAGGIVGCANNKIIDCTNMAEVSGTYAGGMVGRAYFDLTCTNCQNKAAVTGSSYAGGMLGYGYPESNSTITIDACTNDAVITANYAGGMIGYIENYVDSRYPRYYTVNIKHCNNTADINGKEYAGGIVGYFRSYNYSYKCTIQKTYNTGNVSTTYNSTTYAGGIIGCGYSSSYSTITACYNTGNVSAVTTSNNYAYAGGIAGSSATVQQCYNIGTVTAESNSSSNKYPYAIGSSCTVSNSYFLSGTGTTCSGASSRSEKQLKNARMSGGFDFDNDWIFYPCSSYKFPQLRGNEQDTESNDHAFGAWQQTVAPTATTEGEETCTCPNCGATETRTVASLNVQNQMMLGTQTRNGETRLILKLTGDAKAIEDFAEVGFVVTVNGEPIVIGVDDVYASFYNNGVIVTAEQLNCTYVAILEIGNISAVDTVSAQGYYVANGTTVYGNTRVLK